MLNSTRRRPPMPEPTTVYAVRLRKDADGRGIYVPDFRRARAETTRRIEHAEFASSRREAERTLRWLLTDKAGAWHGATPTMRALDPKTCAVVAFDLVERGEVEG